MRLNSIVTGILFLPALLALTSFNSPSPGEVVIKFENYVGRKPLKLDSVTYRNKLKQAYTISKFKYYVGNIRLKSSTGDDYVSSDYFLINEDEPDSREVILKNVPPGEYTSISYLVGVDSLHNCSGAQSGALDPVNAMFWTWNTGYIFLKLEGKSPVSIAPGHIFEFHIGGYKPPVNCIRTVTLSLKGKDILNPSKNKALKIKADVSKILDARTVVDFSKLSSVVDFHNAATIADNYAEMFSIE